MIERALKAGAACSWVAADEVYGNNGKLRQWLEEQRLGYVLAIASDQRMRWPDHQQRRVDTIARNLPGLGWERISAGSASKGERLYDWTPIHGWEEDGWSHGLLVRRSIEEKPEHAYYRFMRPRIRPHWKLLYAWPDNAGRSNKPSKPPNRGPHGRVFVHGVEGRVRDGPLRSPPPARPVSAHRFVHAGVCNLGHSASPWRKKLHADKSHSACRNCAACSPTCCGEHGTALNIGCIGQAGGENIHFTRCATTIANKVPHYRSSSYNCSTRAG
jgi:hypothetical protein